MEEELARVVHEAVRRDVLHRLAPAGELLHRAGRLAAALRDVEEHELALAAHAVVAGDDAHELGGGPGNGLRVEEGVGPIGVGAVVLLLVAAVRVHRHQDAREVMGGVGVLPPQVETASVGKHHGMPVVVLVERDAAEASVRIAQHEVADVVGAAHAGHPLESDGPHEKHLAVGEVHGIVVVDVGGVRGRDLAEPSGGGQVHLRHAPSAFADAPVGAVARCAASRGRLGELAGREGHLREVPVERHVADERVAFVQRALGGGAVRGERHAHEGVRVAAHGHAGVALPVLWQPERVAVAAADGEEVGEPAKGRQAQEDLLGEAVRRRGVNGRDARCPSGRAGRPRPAVHAGEFGKERGLVGEQRRVLVGVGVDGAHHRLRVEEALHEMEAHVLRRRRQGGGHAVAEDLVFGKRLSQHVVVGELDARVVVDLPVGVPDAVVPHDLPVFVEEEDARAVEVELLARLAGRPDAHDGDRTVRVEVHLHPRRVDAAHVRLAADGERGVLLDVVVVFGGAAHVEDAPGERFAGAGVVHHEIPRACVEVAEVLRGEGRSRHRKDGRDKGGDEGFRLHGVSFLACGAESYHAAALPSSRRKTNHRTGGNTALQRRARRPLSQAKPSVL